jgi:hypothetical protein
MARRSIGGDIEQRVSDVGEAFSRDFFAAGEGSGIAAESRSCEKAASTQ